MNVTLHKASRKVHGKLMSTGSVLCFRPDSPKVKPIQLYEYRLELGPAGFIARGFKMTGLDTYRHVELGFALRLDADMRYTPL